MKNILAAVLLCVSLTACGPTIYYTTLRHSADYDARLSRADITALPAYAEVSQGGKGRQYDYEYAIEPILQETAAEILAEKGYRVARMHKKDMKDNAIYKDVDRLHERYKEKFKTELYGGESESVDAQTAYNIDVRLSGSAKEIYEKTGAPLIAFIDYDEYVQSNTERVAGFAMSLLFKEDISSNGVESAFVGVGVIDAENDKILWAHFARDEETLFGAASNNHMAIEDVARKKARRILERAFAELPNKSMLWEDMQKKREMLQR